MPVVLNFSRMFFAVPYTRRMCGFQDNIYPGVDVVDFVHQVYNYLNSIKV